MTDPTPQTSTRDEAVQPCPFCGGPAKTFQWNGTLQASCAGDFTDCAGFDVTAPVAMWNRRASAPAPASGRVEAVSAIIAKWVDETRFADAPAFRMAAREIIASLSPAATPVSEAGGEAVRPEDEAEAFIQAAIDTAPEPLRRLGEWLANKLDDDDWKTADRLITGAAVSCASLAAELDQAAGVISDQNAALAKPASSPAGGDVAGWHLMSTAPKDGDEMLATNASLHGGFPQVVYWEEGRWHVPDAGLSYHPEAFTHWRRDCLAISALSQSTSAGRVGE